MSIRIPGVYVEISGDITKLNKAMNEAKAIVKSAALNMSNALNNVIDKDSVEAGVMGMVRNLRRVNDAAKISGDTFKNMSVDLGSLTAMTGLAEKEFAALQSRMLQNRVTASADRSFNAVTKAAGLTRAEAIALRRSMGDLEGAARMQAQLWKDQVSNGLATASSVMSRVAIVAATLVGIGYTLKEAFDASMRFEGLQRAYTAIYGSAVQADQQLQWLYETSNKLGLQFQSTAEAAKGFFAAGQGTPLEGSLNKIFESVSRAGASLSLGQDQMNGIFLALGQMMSKGKVQAEELRGQLGERLPGAFRIAAQAMYRCANTRIRWPTRGSTTDTPGSKSPPSPATRTSRQRNLQTAPPTCARPLAPTAR